MQVNNYTIPIQQICYGRLFSKQLELVLAGQPAPIQIVQPELIQRIIETLAETGFVITHDVIFNPRRVTLITAIRDSATIGFDGARALVSHIDIVSPLIEAVNYLDPRPEDLISEPAVPEAPEMPRVPDEDPDDADLATPVVEPKRKKKASAT